MDLRTPIALITGSLGSGKTTLLRSILGEADRKLAVLMNEFGEIAIDSRILQGENVQIIELAGGCVCCELAGEFEAAVREIIETIKPELIVVEATGVAEADALAYEVQDNLPEVRLDSVINIVDAYACVAHPQLGYAARSQLKQADVILINKTDLIGDRDLEKIVGQVRKFNHSASIIQTARCRVDTRVLFGTDVIRDRTMEAPHSLSAFESFTYTAERALDQDRFQQLVSKLPPEIYRAKGFLRTADRTYLFNYVAGRTDFEEFSSCNTQLVFIGKHLGAAREDVLSRLRDCEL